MVLLITDAKTQPGWVRRQIQITSLGKKEMVSNITDNNNNPSEESYYWCMISYVVELKPCIEIWFFAFSKKSVWRKKWGEWPQIKRSQVTSILHFLTHHIDGSPFIQVQPRVPLYSVFSGRERALIMKFQIFKYAFRKQSNDKWDQSTFQKRSIYLFWKQGKFTITKVNTYLKEDSDIHLIKEESQGRGAKGS